MRIAVLGTGQVGQRITAKLVDIGHDVRVGSRTAGPRPETLAFADAASFGEVAFNCVGGAHALTALKAAGPGLEGKILIELANPLDFSNGFPPSLSVSNTDSLAEQIQAALPAVKVVKTLNMMSNELMVDPRSLADGDHDILLCGNDDDARDQVSAWLQEWFGWRDPISLGDLSNARGMEAWLLLWTRLYGALGTGNFNLKVVR